MQRLLASPTLDALQNNVLFPRLHYRLLTLCPWASSGPQGLYAAYIQPIYSLYTALRSPLDCLLPRARGACSARPLYKTSI